MKKRVIIDKPDINSRGHYSYYDDNATDYLDSDSVPIRYDKFQGKDLYTTVIDDEINNAIILGDLSSAERSFIRIDELKIDSSGVKYNTKGINTYVFLFDNYAWKSSAGGNTSPLDESYSEIYTQLFTSGEDGTSTINKSLIYKRTGQSSAAKKGLGKVIDDVKVLEGFYSELEYADNFPYNVDTYDSDSIHATSETSDPLSLPVDKFLFDGTQKIYIVVYTSGNAKRWWGTDKRRNRIQIFEINTLSDLIYADSEDGGGGVTTLDFGYADSHTKEGGGGGGGAEAPAFKVSNLKLTINTVPESATQNLDIPEEYNYMTGSVQSNKPININVFNTDILTANPYREITTDVSNYINFIPTTTLNVKGIISYNLQTYQPTISGRQVASAPTQVELDFDIATHDNSSADFPLESANTNNNYKFYVLDWNDMDNKFKDWEDVMDDVPDNEFELLSKQELGLYTYNIIGKPLIHNYTTPGIKTIKSVIFSHTPIVNGKIEPVRWKFVTSRIFLDIPINQYPDFGEVGGADYTTIPWPHTTPIIGGIDEDSKYKISLKNTLAGGKIGNTDIIDEIFLSDANENDELGQFIRKFDLEQVRYFNTGSYDMTSLLGISITTDGTDFYPHTDNGEFGYWDGETNSFSEETSVGEIFISDNSDATLKQDCKLELNCGNLTGKSIVDSSGNSNKGLLIGDYKIKKTRKNRPMRRDSFIKIPKKNSNSNGAL